MKKKNVLLCIVVLALIAVLAITLSACAKASLTLIFIVDGKVYATVNTNGNETIRMPADPQKDGATFEGWYWDEGTWLRPFTANSLLETPITNDTAVYAKFHIEGSDPDTNTDHEPASNYTVTYDANGGLFSDGNDRQTERVESGSKLTMPTSPERAGYTFVGWSRIQNGSDMWKFDTDTITENTTLYAQWRKDTDGLVFSKIGEDYQVTGYNGSSANVVIPNVWDGCKVTSIGYMAFFNCIFLQEITIPETVEVIDNYAFYNCSNLKEITIPENVISIGNNAFANCTNLATVNWNAVDCTSVGKNEEYSDDYTVFKDCTHIAIVNIGADVLSVPAYAFYGCDKLVKVAVADDSLLKSIGGWAFFGCSTMQEITIPTSVTSIGGSAFASCTNLTTIIFAEGSQLQTIDDYAFYGCTNLTTVTFAEGSQLQTIGSSAFRDCSSLQEITIPAGVTSIGYNEFYGCTNLTTIIFAEGSQLRTIGSSAFRDCSSLQEITIPAGVTSIGYNAFEDCTNLTTVTFAEDSLLQTIGEMAFYDCSSLQTVYYGGSREQWSKVIVDFFSNYYFMNATFYYYSADKPDGNKLPVGSYWRWVDGKPTVWKEEDPLESAQTIKSNPFHTAPLCKITAR